MSIHSFRMGAQGGELNSCGNSSTAKHFRLHNPTSTFRCLSLQDRVLDGSTKEGKSEHKKLNKCCLTEEGGVTLGKMTVCRVLAFITSAAGEIPFKS